MWGRGRHAGSRVRGCCVHLWWPAPGRGRGLRELALVGGLLPAPSTSEAPREGRRPPSRGARRRRRPGSRGPRRDPCSGCSACRSRLSMVRRFSMVLQSESDARAGQWVENMRRQGAGRGCARTQLVDCDSLSARVALRVVGRSVVRCGFLCRRFFRYSFLHASTKCIMEVGILLRASARWVLSGHGRPTLPLASGDAPCIPSVGRLLRVRPRVCPVPVLRFCEAVTPCGSVPVERSVTPAYSFWLKACGLEA